MGLFLGIALFLGNAKLLQGFLYGIESWSWRSWSLATMLSGVTALLATAIPVRRALGHNPSVHLHVG